MSFRAMPSCFRLTACVLLLGIAGMVHAAPPPPPPPTTQPKPTQPSAPIEPQGGGGKPGEPQVYVGTEDEKPTIVMKDKQGHFVPVNALSPEEQAFRYFAYTEDQWKKLDAVIDARNREVDVIALREFDNVIAARKLMFELDKYETLEAMKPLREMGRKLSPLEQTANPKPGPLVDRLIAAGALEPDKRKEIDPLIKEYNDALQKYWSEQAGGDAAKIAVLADKEAFGNDVRDAVQSIDRQLRISLPDFIALAKRCQLTSDQLAELTKVEAEFVEHPGQDPRQIVARLSRAKAFFYGTLTVDQAHRFIKFAEARRRIFEAGGRTDADSSSVDAPPAPPPAKTTNPPTKPAPVNPPLKPAGGKLAMPPAPSNRRGSTQTGTGGKGKSSKAGSASLTPSERFAGTRRAHRDETIEDYVEAIAQLERTGANVGEDRGVRVKNLAAMMGVSHVTVVKIVRRLRDRGLVVSERGRPLHLTPDGRRLADAAEARHEVVLGFLRWLGVPEPQAEIDAEGIEHHVSQQTIDAMTRAMGK